MSMQFELTLVQKKQAALLYHFSSMAYLRGLHARVNALAAFVDTALSQARDDQRDRYLSDSRWGERNTAANWEECAWPYLAEFQVKVARDIADRASDIYRRTGCYEYGRVSSEYSMHWTNIDEERQYDDMFRELSRYAHGIDQTMEKSYTVSRWTDFGLALAWAEHQSLFPRLPKFVVRSELEGMTASVPPRTGVYVPADDPHGALQFGWRGDGYGKLLKCSTFNDIGLAALKVVGRRELWFNNEKMFAFARLPEHNNRFREHLGGDREKPILAPSAVARQAFTDKPSRWYFVELIDGEFEDYDDNTIPGVVDDRIRVLGGEPCPRDGLYFTPAKFDSRRLFKAGELMPDFANNWGVVIWQSTD